MKKGTRRIVFTSFSVVFLIVAPLIVFYSMGWRFSWEEKKFIRPGMFYCRTLPKATTVLLEGRDSKKTDPFFGSLLIENISPGKQKFTVQKQGYHSWEKSLGIKKGEVTEAKNIVLVPQEPKFELISKNIEGSFSATRGQETILLESEDKGWSLKLLEADKNLKSHLLSKEKISTKEVDLISLQISPDGKRSIIKAGIGEGVKYFLLEFSSLPASLEELNLPGPLNVYFHPQDGSRIFFLKEKELKELGRQDSLGKVIAPLLEEDSIYFLHQEAFLAKIGYDFQFQEKIAPFPLKQETKYQIKKAGSFIFLKEGLKLYSLDLEGESQFEKVSENIKGVKASPDGKKITFYNDSELWVFFLEDIAEQPKRERGEIQFISRFSEELGSVSWYTSHHLIFNSGARIKVSEIDARDKINSSDLAYFSSPEIFWYQNIGKLCVLSEGNLFCSEPLIP